MLAFLNLQPHCLLLLTIVGHADLVAATSWYFGWIYRTVAQAPSLGGGH